MSRQPRSLRGAINAFCAWCIYDKGAKGTKAEQIRRCTATTCPLYLVRPGARRVPSQPATGQDSEATPD